MRITTPSRFKWFRYGVQATGLLILGELLFVGVFRCPFAVPFISCPTCPLLECPGKYLHNYAVWGLVGSSLLVGRAFCGWLCPLGFIQDWLSKIPKPRFLRKQEFGKWDTGFKTLKYAALAFALLLVMSGPAMVAMPVRTGSNFNMESVRLTFSSGNAGYHARWIAIGLAIAAALLLSRTWCRYLCPLGAFLALANKISLLRLRADKNRCVECGRYPTECPMHSRPGSLDCILCGNCAIDCPQKAINVRSPTRRLLGRLSRTNNA